MTKYILKNYLKNYKCTDSRNPMNLKYTLSHTENSHKVHHNPIGQNQGYRKIFKIESYRGHITYREIKIRVIVDIH